MSCGGLGGDTGWAVMGLGGDKGWAVMGLGGHGAGRRQGLDGGKDGDVHGWRACGRAVTRNRVVKLSDSVAVG